MSRRAHEELAADGRCHRTVARGRSGAFEALVEESERARPVVPGYRFGRSHAAVQFVAVTRVGAHLRGSSAADGGADHERPDEAGYAAPFRHDPCARARRCGRAGRVGRSQRQPAAKRPTRARGGLPAPEPAVAADAPEVEQRPPGRSTRRISATAASRVGHGTEDDRQTTARTMRRPTAARRRWPGNARVRGSRGGGSRAAVLSLFFRPGEDERVELRA